MEDFISKNRVGIITGICIFVLLLSYCQLVGLSPIIPLLLAFYAFHLAMFKHIDARRFLQLGFLVTLITFIAYAMVNFSQISPYLVPVAAVPMLVIMLFNDLQLAFSMSFMAAAVVSLALGMQLDYCIIIFIGGLTGTYVIRGTRTRGKVLAAGIFVGLVQAAGYFLLHGEMTREFFVHGMRPLVFNGLLSVGIVLATLKVFELLFGELTHFSLLELSDAMTQPLLKRLAFEAPGTYHHSLILANLAGAAADTVGADALLVRVGACYHDIGKLVNPNYFTENQMMSDNKHDDLEPSMSRLVILNHVKEGVELGRQNKLNERIIDFIRQHHGTSIIHFFYQKALAGDDPASVNVENYRYPGPKPQTKETAIVMLADAVEGATRALDEHTPVKILETVRKVINNKFIDGQLDECNLTLREIDAISRAFARELSAMYHVRVKYPQAKKSNGYQDQGDQDEGPAAGGQDPAGR